MSNLFLFGQRINPHRNTEDVRWSVFVDQLTKSNFWSEPGSIDLFVDFRVTLRNLGRLLGKRGNRKMLVQVEPRSTNPFQYSPLIERLFDCLITERDHSHYSGAKVYWTPGYDFDLERPINPTRRQKLGSLAGNKYSFVMGSQYRNRLIELDKLQAAGVDAKMAGRGWSRNTWHSKGLETLELLRCILSGAPRAPRAIRVALKKGLKVHSMGEFDEPNDFWKDVECALVIENEEGLVSEKIFDAVSAGCRVLYAGKRLEPSPHIFQLEHGNISSEALSFIGAEVPLDRAEIRRQSMVPLRKVAPSIESGFAELSSRVSEVSRNNESR